jgi:hypothetical protein
MLLLQSGVGSAERSLGGRDGIRLEDKEQAHLSVAAPSDCWV